MIKAKYDISSLDKLSSIASELLKLSDNRIFALYGDLGVGKTTLVKYMCSHLKVLDSVSSPTFSIVNQYVNEYDDQVFHFDFYRLNTVEDVQKIGFDVYLASDYYCFIEWPELVESLLPINYHAIEIKETQNKKELFLFK